MHPERDLIKKSSNILSEQFQYVPTFFGPAGPAAMRGMVSGAGDRVTNNRLTNTSRAANFAIGSAIRPAFRKTALGRMPGYASYMGRRIGDIGRGIGNLLNPVTAMQQLGSIAGDRRPEINRIDTRYQGIRDDIRQRGVSNKGTAISNVYYDNVTGALDRVNKMQERSARERAAMGKRFQQGQDFNRRLANRRLDTTAQQMGVSREELAARSTPQALNTAQQQGASDNYARGASRGLQADLARIQGDSARDAVRRPATPAGSMRAPNPDVGSTGVTDNSAVTGTLVRRPAEERARAMEKAREDDLKRRREENRANTTQARAQRYMERDAAAEREKQDTSVDAQVSRFSSASPEERAEMIRKANASAGYSTPPSRNTTTSPTGSTNTTGRRDTSRPSASTT